VIVTLLTDFGAADYFVAAMKGVILGLAPDVTLVDVTHEIPPQDVAGAAFTLAAAYESFPAGTIHLAVVDPGVGSARRPVVVAGRHLFVGPDNGIFTHVYEREPGARVFHLTRDELFRKPVSATFHGRDVFAPVAGALAAGLAPEMAGDQIGDPVRFHEVGVETLPDGALRARVLHVDRFGNCVTGFRSDHPGEGAFRPGFRLQVEGVEIRALLDHYAAAGVPPGEPFAIWGSAGFLEVVVNRGSAARRLGVAAGSPVVLHPAPRGAA
jgi:S-adenosyl-L-methionine hydrolase (adenosine-forming)